MQQQWILKGARDEKYGLYIEAYALDHINKKENPSDLFLYGTRQTGSRERLVVYGVSHTAQDGDLFAPYQLMKGLRACSEKHGGTENVFFEMDETDGPCRIKGYYMFYEDNPVMKQWLIRERGYACWPALEACEAPPAPKRRKRRSGREGTAQRIVDIGLIAILLTLASVIIDTLNSPGKMSAFVEHMHQIQKMLLR